MITVGIVLFEGVTQLDLTGPYEIFSRWPDTQTILVSKTLSPVKSENGLIFTPDATFQTFQGIADVLFVPGGPGISNVIIDKEYMRFITSQGQGARFVTAVCTGSLVLAAANLLDGYSATTHWLSIDLLQKFGVKTKTERVVVDRNRITGGGVTSGIDLALIITAHLLGEDKAKEIQLLVEYHPQPLYDSGHPSVAAPALVNKITQERKELQQARAKLIEKILSEKAG